MMSVRKPKYSRLHTGGSPVPQNTLHVQLLSQADTPELITFLKKSKHSCLSHGEASNPQITQQLANCRLSNRGGSNLRTHCVRLLQVTHHWVEPFGTVILE